MVLKKDPGAAATALVFCDGACSGNPGPGGYGCIVRVPGQPEQVLSAGKAHTTNNEMELSGAVAGLKAAVALGATSIVVNSDSQYLVKGMNEWVKGWQAKGWVTSTRTPVKNRPLWEELVRLSQGRKVSWVWLRGHTGHPENERCDALALAATQQARRAR
ncbi:MAG: ribonuclease HI [Chloroflexota bacterium]